jgi:hypothetical protein
MILASFYCTKVVSDLESPSSSLLAVEGGTSNSITGTLSANSLSTKPLLTRLSKGQNNREKVTEVETFDPLKPPRSRKKVTTHLSGKRKQVNSHVD